MNILSFEELFDATAFPIFATDTSGEILYKNPATQRYIPILRKGASIKRYLADKALPDGELTVRFIGNTAYRHALSVRDRDGILFLAFPRLQYGDREKVAQSILDLLGDALPPFLDSCREFLGKPNSPSRAFSRLYAELPRLYPPDNDYVGKQSVCPNIFTETMLSHIERLAATLGFRVRTSVAPDFNPCHAIHINHLDLTFLFCQLLYCALRMSVGGTLDILLASNDEYRTYTLRFKISAHTIPSDTPSYLILCHAVPECAADILLMEKAGVLSKMVAIRHDGKQSLIMDFSVPYQTATVSVNSLDRQQAHAMFLDTLLGQIAAMLRETLSSC